MSGYARNKRRTRNESARAALTQPTGSPMDTNLSADQNGQQKAQRRLDAAVRDQFPVIVDFNRRLEKLERKIDRIHDLTILVIAVGLGIAFGQLVENIGSPISWGWPAALTCGATIVVITFVFRLFLK